MENFHGISPSFDKHDIIINKKNYNPFPKKDFSVVQGLISKISGVKSKSGQFYGNQPNILWIDLQDELTNPLSDYISRFYAVISGQQYGGSVRGIYSNPLWYALYADKDTPIFEGYTLNKGEGTKKELDIMQFNGKFANNDNKLVSAIVFNSANAIILCENPYAKFPIPNSFIERFSSIINFSLENSKLQFPNNKLQQGLELEKDMINNLSKYEFYGW